MLRGAEARYPDIEKIGLALVTTARKLRPYFLSYTIVVRTGHPLKATLGKIDTSERMLKWAVDLSQFEIEYEPRISVKCQALADFIHEGTRNQEIKESILYVDGSSTAGKSGAGVIITNPEGEESEFVIQLGFRASNNEAE